jgi:hypothetical protein
MEGIEQIIADIELCTRVLNANVQLVINQLEPPESRRMLEWHRYSITYGHLYLLQILRDIARFGPDVSAWPGFTPLLPAQPRPDVPMN